MTRNFPMMYKKVTKAQLEHMKRQRQHQVDMMMAKHEKIIGNSMHADKFFRAQKPDPIHYMSAQPSKESRRMNADLTEQMFTVNNTEISDTNEAGCKSLVHEHQQGMLQPTTCSIVHGGMTVGHGFLNKQPKLTMSPVAKRHSKPVLHNTNLHDQMDESVRRSALQAEH